MKLSFFRALLTVSIGLGGFATVELAGCSLSELDVRDKACPCAVGWSCDTKNQCVFGGPGVGVSSTGSDASSSGAATSGTGPSSPADADAGGGTSGGDAERSSSLDCPPEYGSAVGGGASEPPDGGKRCSVYPDGYLRCNNSYSGLVETPRFGSAWVDDLNSLFTSYECFERGDEYPGGNATWYRTCGNRTKTRGFVHAKTLYTESAFDADPAKFGLPRCSELGDGGLTGRDAATAAGDAATTVGDSGAKPPYVCPPAYGTAVDGGPIDRTPDGQGRNCRMHADGYLRCTTERGRFVFPSYSYGAGEPVDSLNYGFSAFDCFEFGDLSDRGGRTWYRTCGDRKLRGFVQSEYLSTTPEMDRDPAALGLPRCSELDAR